MENKRSPQEYKLSVRRLNDILCASTFSVGTQAPVKELTKNPYHLIDTIAEINQLWDKSGLFILETVHSFTAFLLLRIAHNLKSVKEVDLDKISFLCQELHSLLTRYRGHIKTQELNVLPISELFSSLSENLQSNPVKTSTYLSYSTSKELLKIWVNSFKVPLAAVASAVDAIGSISSRGYLQGSPANMSFLISRVKADLKNASNQDILFWFRGLGRLAKGGFLNAFIPYTDVNDPLIKLNAGNPSSSQTTEFMESLVNLLKANEGKLVANIALLNYKSIEDLVVKSLRQSIKVSNIASIAKSLVQIIDRLGSAATIHFLVIESLFSALRGKSNSLSTSPVGKAAMAKYIGQTILSIGEIVKTKPYLYACLSKQTEKFFDEQFTVLDTLSTSLEAFDLSSYIKMMRANILALRGSALLGISQPCEACKNLAKKVEIFLEERATELGSIGKISIYNQYALFRYVTQKPGEKFPDWLKNILEDHKPKQPEPESFQAEVVKRFRENGFFAQAEFLCGCYRVDIYYEKDDLRGIVEVNGAYFHSGEDHLGAPKDINKGYVLKFKNNLKIRYIDLAVDNYSPAELVDEIIKESSQKDSKQPKEKPDEQLYEFIGKNFKREENFLKKRIGKVVAGTQDSTPVPLIADPPMLFSLGDDWIDFSNDKLVGEVKETKFIPPSRNLADELVAQAKAGELSHVRKCLEKGNPKNPHTQQPDPYTVVAALLCAMHEKRFSTHDSEKIAKLQAVIIELIDRISIPNLITPRQGLSPLILAVKWQSMDVGIYEHLVSRLPKPESGKNKNEPSFNLDVVLQEAKEAAQKLGGNLHIDYQALLRDTLKTAPSTSAPKISKVNPQFVNFQWSPLTTNETVAVDVFLKKAKTGHVPSQLKYAECASHGKGMREDKELAAHWYSEAAAQGNSQAQRALVEMYASGTAVPKDRALAIRYTELAAENHDPTALYWLSLLYENKNNLDRDEKKALKYLQDAAESHSLAQYRLGCKYKQGNGVIKDYALAVKYLSQAAKASGAALYALGQIYQTGSKEVPKNEPLAKEYFLKAAGKKSAEAQCQLGNLYLNGKLGFEQDFKKAESYYLLSAANGCYQADSNLGLLYLENQGGFERNIPKGLACLDKAAAKKDIKILNLIADIYENGLYGVEKNVDLALKYLHMGYDPKNVRLLCRLADLYIAKGSKEDLLAAKNYFEILAKANIRAARAYMIDMDIRIKKIELATRTPVLKDSEESCPVLQVSSPFSPVVTTEVSSSSSKLQDPCVKLELEEVKCTHSEEDTESMLEAMKQASNPFWLHMKGLDFYYGTNGSEIDIQKAIGYFKLAVNQGEQGYLPSQSTLGKYYFMGVGVEKNIAKSIEYLKKAAAQNGKEAQYILGYIYENGLEVERNLATSKKYYQSAAKGMPEAKARLTFLNKLIKLEKTKKSPKKEISSEINFESSDLSEIKSRSTQVASASTSDLSVEKEELLDEDLKLSLQNLKVPLSLPSRIMDCDAKVSQLCDGIMPAPTAGFSEDEYGEIYPEVTDPSVISLTELPPGDFSLSSMTCPSLFFPIKQQLSPDLRFSELEERKENEEAETVPKREW